MDPHTILPTIESKLAEAEAELASLREENKKLQADLTFAALAVLELEKRLADIKHQEMWYPT